VYALYLGCLLRKALTSPILVRRDEGTTWHWRGTGPLNNLTTQNVRVSGEAWGCVNVSWR
jgi:hypothetical protein